MRELLELVIYFVLMSVIGLEVADAVAKILAKYGGDDYVEVD